MKKSVLLLIVATLVTSSIFADKPIETYTLSVPAAAYDSGGSNTTPGTIEAQITGLVIEVKRTMRDMTGDGEANCQDAAILFKTYWDRDNPGRKSWCTLVSNYKPGVMNHLFARITTDKWVDYWVEPRAYNSNLWDMKYNWGDKYDGRYNVYERTEYWMRRRVR